MTDFNEKTYWAYLDGEGSPEERQKLEQLFAQHPQWKEDMLMSQILHQSLAEKAELSPSPEFSNKIMAALPEKRTISEVAPLLNRTQRAAILFTPIIVFTGIILYVLNMSSNSTSTTKESFIPWDKVQAWTSSINFSNFMPDFQSSGMQWALAGVIIAAFILLTLVDNIFSKRLERL